MTRFELRDALTRGFWRLFSKKPRRRPLAFDPAFDVIDGEQAYVLRADVPGVRREGIQLSFDGDHLVVRGRRDSGGARGEWLVLERNFGTFRREFDLPSSDHDHVVADVDAGVLTISVPKLRAMRGGAAATP